MLERLPEYMKALVPVVVGVLVLAADKLVAGDAVPDTVWLGLMGISLPVLAVPNRPAKK